MNKLKRLSPPLVLLLCGFLTFNSPAQLAKTPSTSHHTLWKIQGKQATVYLLGSVHALQDTDYPLPTVIENAFTNSPVVACETDIGELESPALAIKMMSKSQLPEGQTLEKVLIWTSFSSREP